MLASTCARFNFAVHSFCQMTNHYHLVIETGDSNLSRGMRQLNGLYSAIIAAIDWSATFFKADTRPLWCKKRIICVRWRAMWCSILYVRA
jgi:REP element-mobilizing transposase RayT